MKARDTKGQLLKVGLDQLSVVGVSGVTLGNLAGAAGLSKSGLFAHFRSKERLQIDLLDEMKRVAEGHVVAPAMREREGLPRLQKLVSGWLGWTRRAGLAGGCPVAAALFELDDAEGQVREHTVAIESEWRTLLGQLVDQAIDLGQLEASTDTAQFVWELCGIYLSHHASTRFLRDPLADARAERAVAGLIDRHRSTGDGRRH